MGSYARRTPMALDEQIRRAVERYWVAREEHGLNAVVTRRAADEFWALRHQADGLGVPDRFDRDAWC